MEQELFALLKEREEAARGRMERLQGELAALNVRIAAAQDELSRPEIERKTLAAGRRTLLSRAAVRGHPTPGTLIRTLCPRPSKQICEPSRRPSTTGTSKRYGCG